MHRVSVLLSVGTTVSLSGFAALKKFGGLKPNTTDRGAQFEFSPSNSTIHFLGCERHRTTAYHPAVKVLVEGYCLQLKTRNTSNDWLDHLYLVPLGICATVKSDLDVCPADLVYGTPLRFSGELLFLSSEPNSTDMEDLFNLCHKG